MSSLRKTIRMIVLRLAVAGATLSLSGCDAVMGRSAGEEPDVAAEVVAAAPEEKMPQTLAWEWTSQDRLKWTKSHVENTLQFPAGGGVEITAPDAPVRPDMYLKSPLLEIAGSDFPTIKVDIACVKSCGIPDTDQIPRIYYITDTHDAGVQFSALPQVTDMLAEGERRVLTYDMTRLYRGGSDWVDSKINHIRVELPEINNSAFVIHSVKICHKDEPC